MDLAFHRPVHHPSLAAAGDDDSEAEEKTSDDGAQRGDLDDLRGAELDGDEGEDRAGSESQHERLGEAATSADPQIPEGGSEADLPALDEHSEGDAERRRDCQQLLTENEIDDDDRGHDDRHGDSDHPLSTVGGRPVERWRSSLDPAHGDWTAPGTQPYHLDAEPRTDSGRDGEDPCVEGELRNAGEHRCEV